MSRPIIVALHGVGSTADAMAEALRPLGAVAEVVALSGHEAFDGAQVGRQWFPVAGVTEANRPARVAAALPPFLAQLDHIAAEHAVHRDELVLLGFSQGAILTLATVAGGHHRGRAVAIAGRLAAPVEPANHGRAHLLLVHDLDDPAMPSMLSTQAAAQLGAAGHDIEVVATSGVGHRIAAPTLTAVGAWLVRHSHAVEPFINL